LLLWLIVLNILAILAVFFPWELGKKADAFAPAPAGIAPEWYFMFMFQTLKMIPAKVAFFDGETLGILSFGAAGLIWTVLPFFDRDGSHRARKMLFGIGIFALAYMISLTVYGYMAK